ncbi:glycine cleavage system protein GcvH [Natrarchaeobius oligotrophus]|uniref:Probable glycine cleavage system H protein n=1 Tax=Natrarchaeobius chitinivorans TaxID=1679083 RepID=A0A3N6PFU4_NATCH|nr:glycine cleavage system protein GcvH [Natrarchaeobius chitinivorans]RQG98989.1 glycine cleavage system protein GcvH [Natrarchaeobius chitinivorans]
MEFAIPDGLSYAESHEWIDRRDGVVRVGITDFAQDELGDIVFVELPAEGETLERDDAFGLVESIKAVSDVYAPISGTVVEVNEALRDRPELVNESPFDDGWLIELESSDEPDHLLDADEYAERI